MRMHLRFPVVLIVVVGLLAWGLGAAAAPAVQEPAPGEEAAVGSGFTYQGWLVREGAGVNGSCRMSFRLYSAQNGGVQVGNEQVIEAVAVTDGLFAVVLNGNGEFGPNVTNGQERWLQVSVRCGNEASDTVLPRQALRAVPYALTALTALSAEGLRGRNVSGAAPANGQVLGWNGSEWTPQNAGGGGDITAVTAGQGLTGGGTSGDVSLALNTTFADNRYWRRAGNAGTNPADHFLGTTDNQPLVLRVNNQPALTLVPGSAPGLVGGYGGNFALGVVRGFVIAGGGEQDAANGATANFVTVGGGAGNVASAPYAVVDGGFWNENSGDYGVISGGITNTVHAGATAGTVGGGLRNQVRGEYATVGGGRNNSADADYSHVGGGQNNNSQGEWGTVGGGEGNDADGVYSTVGGGQSNAVLGQYGTIGGGEDNYVETLHGVVGGGYNNRITGINYGQTIGGGYNNRAIGFASTVPGGADNRADGSYSFAAGRQAYVRAQDTGSFVWADAIESDFVSSGVHQFLIRASGGVGINTNTPQNQLHVVESVSGDATPANHVVQIANLNSGNSADVLALKIGGTSAFSSNNFITFWGSGADSFGAIEGNGSNGVVFAGPGNDYAEWLPKRDPTESIERGEIVGVFGGEVARATAGADRVMALSTGAIVAGNDPGEEARDGYALVAFIGQVQIPVRGAVQAGDFIVPSGLDDGTGMAIAPEALEPEQFALVVGQAWESSAEEGVKPVRTVVGLMERDPTVLRLVAQVQALEARLAALEAQMK